MTSIYDTTGKNVACTIVEAGPNVVSQVKTEDSEGYNALQLAFGERKAKNTPNPMIGHFEKAGTTPKSYVREFRNHPLQKELGETISVTEVLNEGDKVSAVGTSKGKGFQGVVKRHGFSGVGQRTHGQHNRERASVSIGASSYPSKVVKGMRMAGRMGGDRVKIKKLKVMKVFPEKNYILITGSVPGHNNSIVLIQN